VQAFGLGADPEIAFAVFVERDDGAVRQFCFVGEGDKATLLKTIQPTALGADPEIACAVFANG
jgi:hypothetical protein